MPDPLVLDRRAALGPAPGLHAVLIGVSDYAYLKSPDEPPGDGFAALQKLDFTAISAFKLYDKLVELDTLGRLYRPLKTVRLLIAPSAIEAAAEPRLALWTGALPTWSGIRRALREWRADVGAGRDEMALFYFGGHGIRRSLEESILLAQDFGDPDGTALERAFRFSNVRSAMVPSPEFPDIGRDQFYFVDACRDKPPALDTLDDTSTPKMFDLALNNLDYRRAPLYLSTPAGGVAAGKSGQQTFFVEALLWALDHASYRKETLEDRIEDGWPIRAKSLSDGLSCYNPSFDARFELTGLISDPILCFARDPPSLTLRISLAPTPGKADVETAALRNLETDDVVPAGVDADPCAVSIPAGLYQFILKPGTETGKPPAFAAISSRYEQIHVGFKMPWLIKVKAAS
jgi:hypothetical protein